MPEYFYRLHRRNVLLDSLLDLRFHANKFSAMLNKFKSSPLVCLSSECFWSFASIDLFFHLSQWLTHCLTGCHSLFYGIVFFFSFFVSAKLRTANKDNLEVTRPRLWRLTNSTIKHGILRGLTSFDEAPNTNNIFLQYCDQYHACLTRQGCYRHPRGMTSILQQWRFFNLVGILHNIRQLLSECKDLVFAITLNSSL